MDGAPGDPEDPADTAIRLSEEEGALLIGEIGYIRERSRLLLGAWGYTASFGTDPLDVSDLTERSICRQSRPRSVT